MMMGDSDVNDTRAQHAMVCWLKQKPETFIPTNLLSTVQVRSYMVGYAEIDLRHVSLPPSIEPLSATAPEMLRSRFDQISWHTLLSVCVGFLAYPAVCPSKHTFCLRLCIENHPGRIPTWAPRKRQLRMDGKVDDGRMKLTFCCV